MNETINITHSNCIIHADRSAVMGALLVEGRDLVYDGKYMAFDGLKPLM